MFKTLLLSGCAALALLVPAGAQDPEPAPAEEPVIQDSELKEVTKGEESAETVQNPALDAVLKNLPGVLKKSWETTVNFSADDGESSPAMLTADVKYQDSKHFALALDVNLEDPSTGEAAAFTVTLVADGTYLYFEAVDAPQAMTQMIPNPAKVELALIEQAMEQNKSRSGGMNPEADAGGESDEALTGMIKDAMSEVTFKEEGSTDALRRYVIGNEEMQGYVTLDKASWFPVKMEMNEVLSAEDQEAGKSGSSMVMTMTGTKMVESFAEGTFQFTPSDESLPVNDLSPMLRMQLKPAGAGAGDEDLEF